MEVPRWGFIKRGSNGRIDFVSPLPCPYNYGSVPGLLGLEGDLLDALVLGPRLPRGARVRARVFGAIGLRDRDQYDDKLVCALRAPAPRDLRRVERFFRFYGWAKGWLNRLRGQPGSTHSQGWSDWRQALENAVPVPEGRRRGPVVGF